MIDYSKYGTEFILRIFNKVDPLKAKEIYLIVRKRGYKFSHFNKNEFKLENISEEMIEDSFNDIKLSNSLCHLDSLQKVIKFYLSVNHTTFNHLLTLYKYLYIQHNKSYGDYNLWSHVTSQRKIICTALFNDLKKHQNWSEDKFNLIEILD